MGKGVGGKKKFPEGAIRINYLHQARHEVLHGVGGHFGRVLAASMGHNIVNIGKKSQIRLSKEIKSQICKGCGGLLLPGVTANAKIKKSHKAVIITCHICNTQKAKFYVEKVKVSKK